MKQLTATDRKTLLQVVLTVIFLSTTLFAGADQPSGNAGEPINKQEGTTKSTPQDSALVDAWLQGKLETIYALNKHLNPFTIDTEIRHGDAYLNGIVESKVHKDLAGELAASIEGINHVENKLQIERKIAGIPENKPDNKRDFSQVVEDVTTTASVKSKLIFGVNLEGNALKINVDTLNGIVTLHGNVDSAAVKDLAGSAAENVSSVREVHNNLKVVERS